MKFLRFENTNGKFFLINPYYIKEVVAYQRTIVDGEDIINDKVCTIILNDKTEFSLKTTIDALENEINESLKAETFIV
jgi:hypothetical protein